MWVSVKKFADLRMLGKARAQTGDEGSGERIGPELKIGVEASGIEVLTVVGKEVRPQARIGPAPATVEVASPIAALGSAATHAIGWRLSVLHDAIGPLQRQSLEFLLERRIDARLFADNV